METSARSKLEETYPVMVLQDRYGGLYSGGRWLAISMADHLENGAYRAVRCLEGGPSNEDLEAQAFWVDPPSWVAVGHTPDEAVSALLARSSKSDEEVLAELDGKVAEGMDDLDAGRVHTAEEVRHFLADRFGRDRYAAE